MDIFFWIVDLIIPTSMIVLGLVYKKHSPRQINQSHGYRTTQSMKSQKTWDYANHRMGELYVIIGFILFVAIIISKMFTPINKEYLSLIHAGIGIIALFICIPIIERELKTNFKGAEEMMK